ncbi:SDR family NAD(P)-dependent oxidoreductase [Streptomyces sp. NPDC058240]|uniref:SDR family NAD(P)-dependent oxidoreductase n=1 Tax=Streptomyces sp. NPDC058240 TaxID=3346396 RepID=UPI0036E9FE48
MVTGVGSGTGRASALEFAQRGAAVAVLDLDEYSARQTMELIVKEGGRAEAVAVAVAVGISDEQPVQRTVAQVVATFGGLYFAVDNAGIPSYNRVLTEMCSLVGPCSESGAFPVIVDTGCHAAVASVVDRCS